MHADLLLAKQTRRRGDSRKCGHTVHRFSRWERGEIKWNMVIYRLMYAPANLSCSTRELSRVVRACPAGCRRKHGLHFIEWSRWLVWCARAGDEITKFVWGLHTWVRLTCPHRRYANNCPRNEMTIIVTDGGRDFTNRVVVMELPNYTVYYTLHRAQHSLSLALNPVFRENKLLAMLCTVNYNYCFLNNWIFYFSKNVSSFLSHGYIIFKSTSIL